MCLVRKILLASLILLAGCKQEVELRFYSDHHKEFTERFSKIDRHYSTVFMGDSITEMGGFEEAFPDSINLGIGGDLIWGTYDVVQYAVKCNPDKIYLMIGVNSLSLYTTEECIAQFDELVAMLSQVLPDTKLVLESVLPRHKVYDCIKAYNAHMKKVAEERGFKYLDLYSLYAVDDKLPLELTEDGLHLKKEAYSVWYEAIKEEL